MMIVFLLGLMDLTASALHLLLRWGIGTKLALIIGTLLLIKSIAFLKNVASVVDFIAAVFLLLAVYGVYSYLNILFALWLLQKAFFSFLTVLK